MRNKYCHYRELHTEADVEDALVRPMLLDFGYSNSEIRAKQSLQRLSSGRIRGIQGAYTPDFALLVDRHIRWVIEVKAPGVSLDSAPLQAKGYATLLNDAVPSIEPVKHYIVTNATETRIYHIDAEEPLFVLSFTDLRDGTSKFDSLREILGRAAQTPRPAADPSEIITMRRPAIEDLNNAFAWCHQQIYKMDNISQSDAFSEFVKIISLKLLSDRSIRNNYPEAKDLSLDKFEVPTSAVQFSIAWIETNASNTSNPVSDILFRQFMQSMDREIALGDRKRIFPTGADIYLKPETIRKVVEKLQGMYLFGIDADLNGRLFETFLNSTMRGKDLGQFFTPRSLVKLGVGLAQLKVDVRLPDGTRHTDMVLDACCGSGGFLIDVLADMWQRVDNRADLADDAKTALKHRIANESIVGVDVANAPILARIARLNMYLHGDGGTRIFHLDALDTEQKANATDDPDLVTEKKELKALLNDYQFDAVVTNPPFAKSLSWTNTEDARILEAYELGQRVNQRTGSVRSGLLFLERYARLLKPGGRMVTVIDDGILSGEGYSEFRDFLRRWFLIRAVVSLPGDAFQRSNARVKTSFLVVERRDESKDQLNPPVFMYACRHVGLDDPSRQRARPGDRLLRESARAEIDQVIRAYECFIDGHGDPRYIVQPERIQDRLDVKHALFERGQRVNVWSQAGLQTFRLEDVLTPRRYTGDEIITKDVVEPVRPLVVKYDGTAEAGESFLPSEVSTARHFPVHGGDIVISNIAATYGSIAVIPEELSGCVVTSEYTVLKARNGFDPHILQLVLRSPDVRAEMLVSASGANRTRVRWPLIRQIAVPYPDAEVVQTVRQKIDLANEALEEYARLKASSSDIIHSQLYLESEHADTILSAFKPPQ